MPADLTIAQAAEACNITRSTITSKRRAGAFPGAHQLSDRTWRIPLTDLVDCGLAARPAPKTTWRCPSCQNLWSVVPPQVEADTVNRHHAASPGCRHALGNHGPLSWAAT